MKKKTQKIVSLLLALAMTASTTCLAAATDETTLEPVYAQSGLMHHSYDNGADINAINNTTNLGFSEDAQVNYDYQLTYYETDPGDVGVQLNVDIISQGNDLSLSFRGDVKRIEVSDDLVILRGPLYTTEEINGTEYEISAGFTKVESRDEINVGLVFSTEDNKRQDLYSIGPQVISDDEYNMWRDSVKVKPNDTGKSPLRAPEEAEWEFYDSDDGDMDVSSAETTASGIGGYLYTFVDEDNDRLMAGVQTASYKLSEDHFTSGGYLAAGLYFLKVSFNRVGAKGNIIGFDDLDLDFASGSSMSLAPIFSPFSVLAGAVSGGAGAYGVMISAALALISAGEISASPRVTFDGADAGSSRAWIALNNMSAVHEVNFDDSILPIPLSVDNSGSRPGYSYWTITLEMEYEVDLTYGAFYIPVDDIVIEEVPVYFEG